MKKGQHQRPHKRSRKGKSFKAGRGKPVRVIKKKLTKLLDGRIGSAIFDKESLPRGREPLEGARRHKLMTEELRKLLPPLYSQEKVKDPIVYVKYFSPYSNWTWLATEFDGTDTFFGMVEGHDKELGYFSLNELATAQDRGLPLVERDIWFKPKKLSEVK
jgi:hypothetical protein